jgi:hypothetical protein
MCVCVHITQNDQMLCCLIHAELTQGTAQHETLSGPAKPYSLGRLVMLLQISVQIAANDLVLLQ